MRKLLVLCLILAAQLSWSQETKFAKLSEALQKPETTHLVISCSPAEVSKFVSSIYKLRQVESLRLEGGDEATDWEAIFKALDHLDRLKELHLSYIEMKNVPAGIDRLCLQSMSVSGCKLLNYHELFIRLSHQPALTTLSLDHNQLEAIPQELAELPGLRSLSISNDPGIDIENGMITLGKLPQLEHLSLRDNDIEELPSSISSLSNLASLDISSNYIEKLPSFLAKLEKLDSLALQGNAFKDLGNEAQKIASIKNLSAISVDSDLEEKEILALRKKLPNTRIELVKDEFDLAVESTGTQPKFHVNSLITPPLPQLTIKPVVYNVSADQGGEIVYASGTKINIPAGALTDAQGNPVTGNVSLSYREFQNPIDILLSGIPMTYDSGGTVNQFETAGMFELYASQGDKELFVKPGAKIDVQLASPDAAPSFNFYALNESSKNWDYIGKAGTIKQEEKVSARSEAWKIYHRWLGYKNGRRNEQVDTKPFAERFQDTSYFYLTKKDQGTLARWNNRGRKKTRDEVLYAKSPVILKTEKRVREDRKGIVKFTITQRWKSNGLTFHNELKSLEGLTLVYDGPMPGSEFRKHFIRKRRFNDIKVSYTPGSSEVTIELKDNNGFESLTASIYSPGEEITKMAKRKLAARYRAYAGQVKQKQRRFDKDIAKDVEAQKKKHEKDEQFAWKQARKAMTKEELAMSKNDWLAYYNQMIAASRETDIITSGITRNLSISGFGVYNCDQVKRLQNPVKVLASYKNGNGDKVSWNTTYVLDKNVRGVLTYSGAYAGIKENEIAFDPNSTQSILVISDNGKVSVMKGEELKGKTFPYRSEFEIKELNTNLSDVNELKKALGVEE